jgi:septum formation topological specificity factor MinE
MFVKALKEHDEALEVIRWLREDILGVIAEHNEEDVDFAQISSSADKLKAYAHLFTQNQMNEFASLTTGQVGP